MGCLGWTEAETMQTEVNAALCALEAHGRLLRRIFGAPEDESKPKPTYRDFQEFTKTHNAAHEAKKARKKGKKP